MINDYVYVVSPVKLVRLRTCILTSSWVYLASSGTKRGAIELKAELFSFTFHCRHSFYGGVLLIEAAGP